MLEFFLVELNSKRLLRVQEKKKKVVVLWSRPPQNVKLGIFTSKSYSDDKEGYKTRVAVLPFSLACGAGVFWAGQIVVNMTLSRAKHSRARKKRLHCGLRSR